MRFKTAWAMPSRWTFSIPPVEDFVARNLVGCERILDPFAGKSKFATSANDISFVGGKDAISWCNELLERGLALSFDAVLFDPPYSPRQLSECYKALGRKVTVTDTQNARMYGHARAAMQNLLKPGGVALSFGWQSAGFGRHWETLEILLVQHGGAHNDTICVAQVKP